MGYRSQVELFRQLDATFNLPKNRPLNTSVLRDLRNTGSDPVAEEDFLWIFGRNKITSVKLHDTFRKAVSASSESTVNDGLHLNLLAGAGPTVKNAVSAFNKDPPEPSYLSMILQISLLTRIFDLRSLANALWRAVIERAQEFPPSLRQSSCYEATYGFLRACKEQTAAYNWEDLIATTTEKMARDLGAKQDLFLPAGPTIHILQGLLDFLTAIQSDPDRKTLSILGSDDWEHQHYGSMVMVAIWAHHLLGLTVCISLSGKECIFGSGKPSVFYGMNDNIDGEDETITLFNAGYRVFELGRRRFMCDCIDSHQRVTAYGSGAMFVPEHDLDTSIQHIYSALRRCDAHLKALGYSRPWRQGRLQQTVQFILPKLTVEVSRRLFTDLAAAGNSTELPKLLENSDGSTHRGSSKAVVGTLTNLFIAFSSVEDLTAAKDLFIDPLSYPPPAKIPISHRAMYIMAKQMLGPEQSHPWTSLKQYSEEVFKDLCAASEGGLTCYYSTLTLCDPAIARDSPLRIERGVPTRLGQQVRIITTDRDSGHNATFLDDPPPGQPARLCSMIANPTDEYYHFQEDPVLDIHFFLESISMNPAQRHLEFAHGDFVSFNDALAWADFIPPCSHTFSSGATIHFPTDGDINFRMTATPGLPVPEKGNVRVIASAVNAKVRWLALAWLGELKVRNQDGHPLREQAWEKDFKVFVRNERTCPECMVEYVPENCKGEPSFVVL